jgi:serine protease Do
MFSRTVAMFCVAAGLFAQTSAPQTPRAANLRRAVSRGYLGVGVVELTDERVKALKLNDDSGLEVKRVDENSPAAKVGIKENDVILELNGKAIEGIEQFQATVGETQPGSKVSLTIWRDGAKQTLSATLVARPESFFAFGGPDLNAVPGWPSTAPRVGFEGEELNPQLAEFFGVKEGVRVRSVTANTPAERAGLKAGDVVVKVNGTPVTNPREISGLVLRNSGRKTVMFTVVRNKKEMTLSVEVAEDRRPSSRREVL